MRALGRCWAAVSNVFTGVPADPARQPPPPAPAVDTDFVSRLSGHLLGQRNRLVAACLATVLGPAVVVQARSLGLQAEQAAGASQQTSSSASVPTPVPGDRATWIPLARQAAATCPGLPTAVLVAIGHIESNLGLRPEVSSAGATGPMQFLPSTWAAYGVDGDGDGLTDVMNPVDAVHGAARLLCANGGADPARLPSALWNYNHSDDYVLQVMSLARFVPVES